MSKTFVSAVFGLMCIVLAGCEQMAPVHDVAWYQDPENVDAMMDIVKRGKENPGQYRNDPNYINAEKAYSTYTFNIELALVKEFSGSAWEKHLVSTNDSDLEKIAFLKKNYTEDQLRKIIFKASELTRDPRLSEKEYVDKVLDDKRRFLANDNKYRSLQSN